MQIDRLDDGYKITIISRDGRRLANALYDAYTAFWDAYYPKHVACTPHSLADYNVQSNHAPREDDQFSMECT